MNSLIILNSSSSKSLWTKALIIVSILTIVLGIFGYFSWINLPPFGLHFTRQTDSISFASHYYFRHNSLLHPATYSLQSTDGNAACEAPFLYYFQCQLFYLFGEQYWIMRGTNLLIFLIGLTAFSKMLLQKSQSYWLAGATILMVFSSAIVLFYAINFLPDIAALGFILIGIERYESARNKAKSPAIGFLFFTLGGLLKVTYLLYPIALLATEIALYFFPVENEKSLAKTKSLWFFALLLFSTVVGWNLYAIHYNSVWQDTYFLTHATPYWSYSKEQIDAIWLHITDYWKSSYIFETGRHLFLATAVIGIGLGLRKRSRELYFLIIAFVGCLCYFVLFFEKLRDHDYYFLVFLPWLAMLFCISLFCIEKRLKRKPFKLSLAAIVLVIGLLSFNYGLKRNEKRRSENKGEIESAFIALTPEVKAAIKSKVHYEERILIIGDPTPNACLLALHLKGFSAEKMTPTELDEKQKGIHASFVLFYKKKMLTTENKVVIWENEDFALTQ